MESSLNPNIRIEIQDGFKARSIVDAFYKANGSPHTARPQDTFFLAFDGEKLIGCVRFCIEEETAMLRSMRVDANYQGQGVGRKLLEEFQNYLNLHQIRDTYCIPYEHLDKFYALIGFKIADPETTPDFLLERIATYRLTGQKYLCMWRP